MAENRTGAARPAASADLSVGHWTLDAGASTVGIQHKSMWGMVTIKAAFTRLSGTGETLPDGSARGTLSIDAASVASGKPKLDVHLRTADFFDVEQFPEFTFEAERVAPKGTGTAEVTGRLTVLGRTRPLGFTARTSVAGPDEVTLNAEVDVDRDTFGMSWNKGGMLKGLTRVTVSLRFVRG
ncbi:YceI family protein [Streptacidiphilus sp. P02-A3a]|uniref:YceI family protein n=1 Tax=Streptacidiphilus sp. P02-A3a TaxID=2704468 RepID=UPI0015FC14C2|nr:YceI family protein [Streptacidiphilus sp. P02-A3a]QMU68387.1 YceI family protein [Streptacidiphilus sp. P02-A3a]